jgi:activating signal cointegrator 1
MESQMKTLSVKQPWANMIASGQKTIETRTWRTTYRGHILIVSSRRPRIEPAGFAVAVAILADCRPMIRADESKACCKIYDRAMAWMLEEVRPLQPIAVKGALGIYDCPLEIHDLIFIDSYTLHGHNLRF